MHCIWRIASLRYQIISNSDFRPIQSIWWRKTSCLTEPATWFHQTTDQVDNASRHKSLLFLVPSSAWYHAPLSWGCLSLILSAKWQMEKLFAIEMRIFYQTSYKWGLLNFNLLVKHWQKKKKKKGKVSTGHPVRSPQELVCFGSTFSQ